MEHGIHISQANQRLNDLMLGRDTRWYKGRLLGLTMCLVLVLITSMTNGYDGSMMNGLQSLTYWENYFDHPTGGTLGLFNAIQVGVLAWPQKTSLTKQNIGGLCGLPFGPFVSDRFGRRATIFGGSASKSPYP
jgi:hypothetical protein